MILERFGTYTFPIYGVTDTLGAEARADMYSTPLGGFDPNGAEDAIDRPGRIVKRCEIYDTSATAFQTALDAARALRGTRDKLWARTAGTGEVRWLWARCQSITVERGMRNVRNQAIVFTFAVPVSHWNGRAYADWTLDDTPQIYLDTGYYLDTGNYEGSLVSSPDAFTITNQGNRRVTNVILAVNAGSSNITAVTIALGSAQLTWTGTLVANKQLLIDSGSYRVTNDGANAYSGLAFGASHTIDDWLRVEPGANTLTFTWTGGGTGSTFSMNFWDGWF